MRGRSPGPCCGCPCCGFLLILFLIFMLLSAAFAGAGSGRGCFCRFYSAGSAAGARPQRLLWRWPLRRRLRRVRRRMRTLRRVRRIRPFRRRGRGTVWRRWGWWTLVGTMEMQDVVERQTKNSAGAASLIVIFVAFLVILFVLGLGLLGIYISGYNRVIRLDQAANEAWANVDAQLQRRLDLIPNLVATVQGYATHEKEIFENIAQARTKYFQADNVAGKIEASNELTRPALPAPGAPGAIPAAQGQPELPLAAGPARRHGESDRRRPHEVQPDGQRDEHLHQGLPRLVLRQKGRRSAEALPSRPPRRPAPARPRWTSRPSPPNRLSQHRRQDECNPCSPVRKTPVRSTALGRERPVRPA